jgi:hypothetical protein
MVLYLYTHIMAIIIGALGSMTHGHFKVVIPLKAKSEAFDAFK